VATDGRGGVAFEVVDLQIAANAGPAPEWATNPVLLMSKGRFVWASATTSDEALALIEQGSGLVTGQFEADVDTPSGWRLVNVEVPASLADDDPYGINAIGCRFSDGILGPLTLQDLTLGRCVVDEIIGARAVMTFDRILSTEETF